MMSRKILLRTIIGVLSIIGIAILIIQIRAEKEVEEFLRRKIPSHIRLDYENISANIFTGSIHIEDFGANTTNRQDTTVHTTVKSDYLKIEGLHYWPFLFEKTLKIKSLRLSRPIVKYFPDKKSKGLEQDSLGVVKLLKTIIVDRIEIENGSFFIFKKDMDSMLLESDRINFTLNGFKTDPKIIKRKIPLEHKEYTFSAGNCHVDLGSFESMDIKRIQVRNKNLVIDDIRVKSKYGKETLSNFLEHERDHVVLEIPKLNVYTMDFGFRWNKFFFHSDKIEFTMPKLEVFRDKRLADDNTNKNMYSRLVRKLPIDIKVPKIEVKGGRIGYEERLHGHGKPGRLYIDDMSTTILGLDTKAIRGDTTKLMAKGLLMGKAPIKLDYLFDLNDENEAFLVMGNVSSLQAEELNPFFKPNLNVETEGYIDEMYFTISGDAYAAKGDMKMRYNDFRFDVLRKDGKRVNKILTAIGNLFVNDGEDTNDAGFRFGQIEAERNMDKSFFNYIWLNIKSGIVSTLTGNGKKKD
ncbi:hypothetical protein [Sediminicola sp. 1XM1-17]|uniref:hypothetical protein n=1 Tax=Sediminicola sp. 1XM1-17 TaxID=3127702 RepID=UPI0030770D05